MVDAIDLEHLVDFVLKRLHDIQNVAFLVGEYSKHEVNILKQDD